VSVGSFVHAKIKKAVAKGNPAYYALVHGGKPLVVGLKLL
jgi:hypothetical protein